MNIVLSKNTTYSEEEIFNLIRNNNPSLSESSLKWLIYEMETKNQIQRIGKRKYISFGNMYSYEYQSELTKKIDSFLYNEFPSVKAVIWESKQINEWINLLISKNIIFVEIETGIEDIVFDSLKNEFHTELILLNPNDETIYRYMKDDLIVVKSLFSRSPVKKNSHKLLLEKLIVDLVSDKQLINLLGTSGIEDTILGIKNNYVINIEKMITYAKRRKVLNKLNDIWGGLLW